jgi:cyclic-di-GMP-binding protein
MFGFLTPQAKDHPDPLQTPKSASVWLRQLPTLDVIGRQQQVMRAFDGMRQSRKPPDLSRVAAIEFLDAALGADRRQLTKQYVENIDGSTRLAERLWQAVHEMVQGFIFGYQAALEQALAQTANPRWKQEIPLLFSRLIHYYGTDAKLRVFRYERWIPAKWMDLHRLYVRAQELGVDRVPATLGTGGQHPTPWTAEQEYLFVLLVHQLNTGNLAPAELDWACAQLRAWSRKLSLDSVPESPEGFFVDVAGKGGLIRRTGNDSGSMLRYVDTTPVADQLERAIHALRQAEETDRGPAAPINQQRIAILEKVRPAVSPNLNADLRRDPRVAVTVPARVRVGLGRICRDLAAKDINETGVDGSTGGAEQIEVYAVAGGPRARPRAGNEHDSLAASISSFSDPMWQVKDRSVAGLRIAASGGIGQSLALGALVAVRQSDVTEWVLGVVRRLNKVSNEDVEAGVSIIAERVVPVQLHSRRDPRDDLAGIVVDGIDVSTMGARFEGLYLPPPSRPDKPLTVKTLIVPTSEYAEGRNVILTTGRSVYTVALRHLVEQRAEWSWAAIQIIEKKPKEV